MTTERRAAILLLGPTGAGKTPLGDQMAAQGLAGRRCVHCDFGANLRAVGAGKWRPDGLSDSDIGVVRDSLRTGALLEDHHFYIAAAVVRGVMARESVAAADLLILNGMPRHVGQAAAVDDIVSMHGVVWLDCPAEVVVERIRLDSGGDRGGRVDDALDAVVRKLETFRLRTVPLLDHYRALGVRIASVTVGVDTQPAEVVAAVERTFAQ